MKQILTLIQRFLFGTPESEVKNFDPEAEIKYLRKEIKILKTENETLSIKNRLLEYKLNR